MHLPAWGNTYQISTMQVSIDHHSWMSDGSLYFGYYRILDSIKANDYIRNVGIWHLFMMIYGHFLEFRYVFPEESTTTMTRLCEADSINNNASYYSENVGAVLVLRFQDDIIIHLELQYSLSFACLFLVLRLQMSIIIKSRHCANSHPMNRCSRIIIICETHHDS
jgi:hypothetical protein